MMASSKYPVNYQLTPEYISHHRLSSSYDFSAPQSVFSMQLVPSIQSQYSEPTQLNHSDSETYTYFDPWDDVDKQNDNQVPCESFQNYDSSLDNYLDTKSNSEVNYSDHYTQFSDLQTNHKFVSEFRDSSSTPQYHTPHNSSSEQSDVGTVQYSNHTAYLPTVYVVREPLHSVVPINDGGGDPRLWSRPSRQDSLSQPEQRVSERVPLPLPLPEAYVVVETHTHSHVLPSSVQHVSAVEQTVDAPSPEPDAGLAGALASVTLGAPISAEQAALEEHLRRQGWEQGNIDYMGKDSFSNIWQKICDTLAGTNVTPVEVPAPVAPVAAPTYVSSVEISPTGPIDTSPPASYAPVSASKPTTIVASDTEPVTPVTASAETTTVVPEPKSPSVTELISTSAALDSAAKLQTPSSEASRETSTSLLESLSSVALLPSSGTQDPSTAVSGVQSPITAPLVLPTTPAISSEIPISKPETTGVISSESPTEIQPVQAPTPLAITPTETIVQTPVPLPSSQTEAQSPVPSPATPVSKSVTDPLVSIPTDSPVNVPIPLPSSPTEALGQIPVLLPPSSTSQPPVPTTPIVDSPVVPTPPTPAQPVAPAVPQAPEITSPSLPPTPLSTPPSSQTSPIASPPSKGTPEQPSTPTVTGPTPPTSPPVGAVESPLAAKLQVESEVPATPPVGESSSPPSLSKVPSDEPPVPPKRKGGSKTSQEPKGQKGKPGKGKK